jgi:hypothetical protein
MSEKKQSKALYLDESAMTVALIGREDSMEDSDLRCTNIQEALAKMILLGKKIGRPRQEDEPHEVAA